MAAYNSESRGGRRSPLTALQGRLGEAGDGQPDGVRREVGAAMDGAWAELEEDGRGAAWRGRRPGRAAGLGVVDGDDRATRRQAVEVVRRGRRG